MEDSYGISFGKKSKTVTRDRGIVEDTEKQNQSPAKRTQEKSKDIDVNLIQFPPYIVGHPARNDRFKEDTETLDIKNKSLPTLNLDHLFTPNFTEDLPHPSKLRKLGHRKQTKLTQSIEKQMCVDNHLRQLRQRNHKYNLYKMEEQIPHRTNSESELVSPQRQENEQSNIAAHTQVEQTPLTNLPFQSSTITFQHVKKAAKSKCIMFPPGSVLLGSASLEQEEEEKWFQQLWKPRNSSRPTEE